MSNLENVAAFAASSCGSACGAGDPKPEEKPASACGSACGTGDPKQEEKPASACGSACGAGDPKQNRTDTWYQCSYGHTAFGVSVTVLRAKH